MMIKMKAKMTAHLVLLLLAFTFLLLPVAATALFAGGETAVVNAELPATGGDNEENSGDSPHLEPDCNVGICPVRT